MSDSMLDKIQTYIEKERKYEILTSVKMAAELDKHPIAYNVLREIDLIIAFCSQTLDRRDSYLLGIAQGVSKPTITFTTEPGFPAPGEVPSEYEPRVLMPGTGADKLLKMLTRELVTR